MRQWWEPGGRVEWQLVVPTEKIDEVLREVHGAPLASHFGRTKST